MVTYSIPPTPMSMPMEYEFVDHVAVFVKRHIGGGKSDDSSCRPHRRRSHLPLLRADPGGADGDGMTLCFFVPGLPTAQGRPRSFAIRKGGVPTGKIAHYTPKESAT